MVKNSTLLMKIAPAFLLASTMIHAQTKDSVSKEKKIEEVVLIGYGKQKKTDLTGSISSVTSKDFNGGAGSPAQLILGKTPGVQITNNSGAPGSGASIRVRGISSITGNNTPLIVIDGVPQDFQGISGASDPLSLINPNDIQSFDILKDASASAIYGNRASNGVILITTKKGTAGKLKLNFSTLASVSTIMDEVDVLSAKEFRKYVKANITDPTYLAQLGNADTNWQDLIYQEAWGTDNNLSLSGGIKGLPYRLSLGYNDQMGLVKTNSFKRTSVGLNLNPKFLDNHLSVDINAKGTFTDNRFPAGGVISNATYFDPTQPVYSGNQNYGGYYEWLLNNALNVNGTPNPVAQLEAVRDRSSVMRGLGNIQLDYKFHFLPELHFNVNAGYDYAKSNGSTAVNGIYKSGFNDKGSYREYSQEKRNKLLETYFSYNKKVSIVNMDLVAGYAYQNFYNRVPESTTVRGTGQNSPVLNYESRKVLLSFYGRGIFTIADKYILSVSARRDASSRFYNGTTDNIWGTFPGVSLAWKINEENFLKDKGFSTLKLRGGWGQTGNQEIEGSDYPAYAAYNQGQLGASYQFGNQYYFMYRPDIYNPYLRWETTTSKNLGLDFGFAKNRIYGNLDFYQKDTKDLIIKSNIAAGDLSNSNILNVGTMQTNGVEGSVTFVAIKNDKTQWDLSFNATKFDSKITKLVNAANDTYNISFGAIAGGVGNTIQAHAVGYQPFSFFVFQQVYDSAGKPMDGVYVDRNNDGVINANDMYYYKSTQPEAILGFNTKLTHKDWDFGFSGRAVLGNYVYNNAASNSARQSVSTNSYLQNIFSTSAEYNFAAQRYFSDIFVEDASFFRLDNINAGYNFRDVFSKGSNIRVYAMLQNVFVITKYSGVDPEVFNGIDNGYYQMPKVYSLGFNFQF